MYLVNAGVACFSLTGIIGMTIIEPGGKYQTLVTPGSWVFCIWGLIFAWEGVFVMAQFFPLFRQSQLVHKIAHWWWIVCIAQLAWSLAACHGQIILSFILMLGILASLVGLSKSADRVHMNAEEYVLLRAPFALHFGWIIAASIVSMNVFVDSIKWPRDALFALTAVSNAIACSAAAIFTLAVRSPDPFVGFAVAWTYAGIHRELGSHVELNEPIPFNDGIWEAKVMLVFQFTALGISILTFIFGVLALLLKGFRAVRGDGWGAAVHMEFVK
jgi:hypothetical protein